jgi:hypothetical protein
MRIQSPKKKMFNRCCKKYVNMIIKNSKKPTRQLTKETSVHKSKEKLRREHVHVSRPGGGGCGSSRSDACPLPFTFSEFPFRPGNLGLFGALLQPPAPEKNQKKTS